MDISKFLTFITETEKNHDKNMKVMSLADFLLQSDIEPPKSEKNDEVDEAKLSKVSKRTLGKDELTSYLNKISSATKEKKDKYNLPFIHKSNIPVVGEDGNEYDLEQLKKLITTRPKLVVKQNEKASSSSKPTLLKQNTKMSYSDESESQFYNIGIPALKGLAVDEETNEFIVIDTCPGAGSCKVMCYAMQGGYVQWPITNLSQTRLLNFLYNDPDGFMKMLTDELATLEKKNDKKGIKTKVRWHDAGDFFSPEYLSKAYELAKKFPNIDFYAYTKISDVALGKKPENFIINFSMGAKPKEENKIDTAVVKHSQVVPNQLFKDLLIKKHVPTKKIDPKTKKPKTKVVWRYKDKNAVNTLKQRISAKYKIDIDCLLTYDEMLEIIPSNQTNKYNVIVKPGDGDESANRKDVLGTYLLAH